MIRGRFSRGQRETENGGTSTADAPLFNLDEIYERRILSWSPEPDEEPYLAEDDAPADDAPPDPGPERVAARREPEGFATPAREPLALATTPAPPAPAAPVERAAVAVDRDPAPAELEVAGPSEESAPGRRRGRPRGRPRRQVHFHVDPDEERLLMKAVEMYGSQQKALVAALEALQEADLLRDQIDELRRESERQRALLAKAESLFSSR